MRDGRTNAALLVLVLLGTAVVFLALCVPLFKGEVYVEDDLSAYHLPMRHFYQQCLTQGDSFLWTPRMYCGFYLHGEGQVGMCHPWHLLLYRFLPLSTAFNIELLASYLFAFAGMIVFLRRVNVSWFAAAFGAFLFTFCGFLHAHYVHIMIPAIVAHIPWLLTAIDALFSSQRHAVRMGASAGIVLLTASEILLGFPQCVYFSLLIEGAYVIFLLVSGESRGARLQSAMLLGAAKASAFLIGAVQILPSYDALQNSYRAAPSLDFAASGSMHPMNWLQTISAYLFNRRGWDINLSLWWDAPYLGAVAPVLLVWAILRWKYLGPKRPLLAGCGVLAVLGVILSLGDYGYIYRFWASLPGVGLFRNGSRHLLLVHIAMAVAVGVAVADLATCSVRNEKPGWRRLWWLALPAFATVVVAAGVVLARATVRADWFTSADAHFAPSVNVLAGPALMIAATALVILAARGSRYAVVGIILFTLVDVSAYGLRNLPHRDIASLLKSVPLPPDLSSEYRVDPDNRPVTDYTCATMWGLRTPSGWAALIPKNVLDYYGQQAALDVAGVRWRRSRVGGPAELAEAAARGIDWVENPNALPRVRLVSKTVASEDPYGDIDGIDVASTALVSEPLSLDGDSPGEAELVTDRPGDMTIKTYAPAERLLVVSERYHSGWRATANGVPKPVIPVYGDLMACVIGAGENEVRLVFVPDSFRVGLRLTCAGIALALVYHAALVFGFRKSTGYQH